MILIRPSLILTATPAHRQRQWANLQASALLGDTTFHLRHNRARASTRTVHFLTLPPAGSALPRVIVA
jgi:hypothetical protein